MYQTATFDRVKTSKGEENDMTTNLSHIKEADLLVDATIKHSISWINLSLLKDFLKEADSSIDTIPPLHEYLLHLQKDLFIFDCKHTYLTIHNNTLFVLAKSKHSLTYRADSYKLKADAFEWQNMKVPMNILLRIRNAIEIVGAPMEIKTWLGFFSAISSNTPD